jgi:hypothetical protein
LTGEEVTEGVKERKRHIRERAKEDREGTQEIQQAVCKTIKSKQTNRIRRQQYINYNDSVTFQRQFIVIAISHSSELLFKKNHTYERYVGA